MKKFILLLGILLLSFSMFGCLDTAPETGNRTQDTGNLAAQYGDNVTVDYTLTVDGRVMDTTSVQVAKNAGIYDASRSYQPFSFQMLLGGQIIRGFVNGVLGMHVGESKTFTVSPADGYGLSDPELITYLPRYYNKSLYEEVPIGFFEGSNITLEKGNVFAQEIGYVGIYNVTNDTVTIMYLFEPGHKFAMHGLPQSVANITNDTMLIRYDVVENNSYMITNPVTGKKSVAMVTYADNDTFLMDENPFLAGKELQFDVTMRSIVR